MLRLFHSRFIFVFLILMNVGGFSMYAWGESAGAPKQKPPMPMKPISCQEMIVELQNQLHAANQTIELLRDENNDLRRSINKSGYTIQELKNTIRRIRNDLDRGRFGRGPVPQ